MKTSRRIIFSSGNKLNVLRPVLDCWFDVLSEYAERAKPDLPWWYAERSQIGFLALAAWRAGGVALEEWVTEKGPNRERKLGRNDLWIRLHKREFFIEAKHDSVHFHEGREKCEAVLKKTLDDASSSAKALRHQPKVAAAFLLLFWNPEIAGELQFDRALMDWEGACKRSHADLVALVVDDKLDNERAKRSSGDQSVGLAVLLTRVGG